MNKVKLFLFMAVLAYGQSSKMDKLKEGKTDESITIGKIDKLREGAGAVGGLTSGNPAVFSQAVDWAFINSIEQGVDFLEGGKKSRLKLHLSKSGEVSVGYATNTHTFVLEYSKDLEYIKTMMFENEWSVAEMRRLMLAYESDIKGGAQYDIVITEGSIRPVFTKDDEGNYYFFFARHVKEPERDIAENMAVVKYDRTGKKVKTFRLKASELGGVKWPNPHRIEVSGDTIAIFFSRTMFVDRAEGFGFSHTGSASFFVNKNTMERAESFSEPSSSHSFDQFILPVEGGFAFADQCDGSPDRAFLISASTNKVQQTNRRSFSFKRGSAYQILFSQMGGLAETTGGFIFAGAYEKNDIASVYHNDSRNLFVLTMGDRLDNMSMPIWITDYTEKRKENAASPKIVGLGGGRTLLMWELFAYSGYVSTYMTIIDHTGKRLIQDKELPGVRLNTNDALRYDKASGNVYWVVSGPDMDINIYSFNPDKPVNIARRTGAPIDGYGLIMQDLKSEKMSVSQNEVFTVKPQILWELFEKMPASEMAAVLVDNNNNIVAIIGTENTPEFQAGNYQMATSQEGTITAGGVGSKAASTSSKIIKNAFVPETVKPGQYRLRIAFKKQGNDEWRLITTSYGDAHYGNSVTAIPFTVLAETESTLGLSLDKFSPKKTEHVLQNEEFTASVQLRNNTSDAFSGEIGAVLVDNSNKIVATIGNKSISSVKAQSASSSISITCSVPQTVKEGKYHLRIAVKTEGNDWEIVTKADAKNGVRSSFEFNVVARKAIVEDYGLILESLIIRDDQKFRTQEEYDKKPMLTTIEQSENFTGGYRMAYTENYITGRYKGDVGFALLDKDDNIATFIWTTGDGHLSASIQKLSVPKTVAPGQYKLKVMIRPEGKEWRVIKLTVPGVVNELPLTVTAPKQLALANKGGYL